MEALSKNQHPNQGSSREMMNLALLKAFFLSRLRDQPPAHKYPKLALDLVKQAHPCHLNKLLTQKQAERTGFWQDFWWEWQGAKSDYKHSINRMDAGKILRLLGQDIPISYLVGSVLFMGNEIRVRPPSLIPRPDTEAWINTLLKSLSNVKISRLLEIGTGSGCIALGLAKSMPGTEIVAIDNSNAALRLARHNYNLNGRPRNLKFVHADVTKSLDALGPFDLVISNPPYIPKAHRTTQMSPATRRWEAYGALHADLEGTFVHRCIIDKLDGMNRPSLAMELDGTSKQYHAIETYAKSSGCICSPIRDVYKRQRAILIKRPDSL